MHTRAPHVERGAGKYLCSGPCALDSLPLVVQARRSLRSSPLWCPIGRNNTGTSLSSADFADLRLPFFFLRGIVSTGRAGGPGARRAPATCVSTKCCDGSRWKRGSASNTRGSACSALPRCSSCVWSRQCVHAGESARSAVTARSSPIAARLARSITAPSRGSYCAERSVARAARLNGTYIAIE